MTTEYVYLCACCGVAVSAARVRFGKGDGMPFCSLCIRPVDIYCHTPLEALATARRQGLTLPAGAEWGR